MREIKKEGREEENELGHSVTKRKHHISSRCFVYRELNIRLWGNIWKTQCFFHCTDNCWRSYRLFPCVYVSAPFRSFCGQVIKACLVGGMTSYWPQKLIFPATKYTDPADDVVITEQVCWAEVILSRDKGTGGGGQLREQSHYFQVCVPACWSASCWNQKMKIEVSLCFLWSFVWKDAGVLESRMVERKEQMKSRSKVLISPFLCRVILPFRIQSL
jgi:hypothetical protein